MARALPGALGAGGGIGDLCTLRRFTRTSLRLVNPLWGLALDRAPVKMVASALFVTTAAALGMWLLPPSTTTLVAGLVLFGITSGGTQVASELIWATYYGRLSLGAVRGIAFPIQTTVTSLGPLTLGLLYDLSGSYASSFALMALTCVLAAGLVQLAQPPKRLGSPSPAAAGEDR